jgi:hypothetical protein
MKGTGLDAIHEDFVRTLGKEAVASAAMTKSVQNARFAPTTEAVMSEPAEGWHGPVEEAIVAAIG